jgi:benzoate membrane transport protein
MPLSDISVSAIVAGFVAVLIGFSSSVAIVFQAAQAVGASPEITSSWILALGIGMGLSCLLLSLYYRAPIIIAWSTPGAALLATSLTQHSINEAVAAFIFSGILTLLAGISGLFERMMNKIPVAITSAMLAGVLLSFGLQLFVSLQQDSSLVLIMMATYLLVKKITPRYAILAVLLLATFYVYYHDMLPLDGVKLAWAQPVWVAPVWSIDALIGLGIPLFVVTMTAQNMPGVAVLRSSGYQTPVSGIISWTGITTIMLAPFGGFSFNLAAITAAICTGPDAHHDANKRYVAGVAAGCFYLLAGLVATTIVSLFAAYPKSMISALAGLALLGTIAANLSLATRQSQYHEAAIVTFLLSASGVSFFGIASAFWGIIGGSITMLVYQNWRPWRGAKSA